MYTKLLLVSVSSVFVLLLLGGIIFFLKNASNDNVPTLSRESPLSQESREETAEPEVLLDSTSEDVSLPTAAAGTDSSDVPAQPDYVDPALAGTKIADKFYNYSQDVLDTFLLENKRVILFFYASWCPTCRMAEKDIISNNSNLPSNIVVLKIDYDAFPSVKTKYNIIEPNTLVLLNVRGVELKRWEGGEVVTIVENLK